MNWKCALLAFISLTASTDHCKIESQQNSPPLLSQQAVYNRGGSPDKRNSPMETADSFQRFILTELRSKVFRCSKAKPKE